MIITTTSFAPDITKRGGGGEVLLGSWFIMSTPPEQGIKRHPKSSNSTSEASATLTESSLTWCLAQLDADKRLKAGQWRALVAIRMQHIKGGGSRIARYQSRGGLPPLLDLLRRPESSRKFLDLALSILANCCTEKQTRLEVRKMLNVSVDTVQNLAARALGNLAMDPEGSAEVHSAAPEFCAPKLECVQSAARALVYLSDTPANRLLLLSQGALPSLALFIAPEYPLGLRRASLRAIHELTRGCSAECAREMSRSGALTQLGLLASAEGGRPLEELALKTLANLCSQGCLRPLVGSLGVIQNFAEEVKKDPLKSGVFFKALCLCCREAVNRAKVKESGGLEVLISFLSAHQNHPLTRFAFLACVDFVYDESALEQLQELGLVPLLIMRLVELAHGEEPTAGKMDASLSSSSPCSELMTSFVCVPSSRSWLVSEGLISSEGDPPVMSKTPVYHHPYHPEAWAPESPILLLLSRFSHASDPSTALINTNVFSGLLYYLTQHHDPSGRCFRMLGRLSCNPNCFQALVRTGAVALIRQRLCMRREEIGGRLALLSNLRVQSESGFGTGVLTHIMLSGSESDKLYCVLSLPLINSLLSSSKEDRKNCSIDFQTRTATTQVLDIKSQPQQNQSCPYLKATHDLTFLLDDGTLLLASHEAVTGEEGAKDVGSEYFRALLMGGFGEAQKAKSEAIRIKDVKSGMLLPVLHYLHGCRLTDGNKDEMSKQDTNCLVLSSLASGGLLRPQDEVESCLAVEMEFQKSPLAEVMIGACRFLVAGLQRAAEDLSVDLLYSVIRSLTKHRCSKDITTTTSKMDAGSVCRGPEGSPQLTKTEVLKCSKQHSKSSQSSRQVPSSSSSSSDSDTEGAWLRSLLPQVYWFSQRYSYLRLGQACLSILLRPQGLHPAPLHSSLSTDCFLRLAQEADCAKGLRQDILHLVKTALS
uniref:Armadillo repeat-containing protein 5-like n=1 Tax=Sinocyclocheilus grahami TaxID=75366 RepID=A0A672JUV8_SINGR